MTLPRAAVYGRPVGGWGRAGRRSLGSFTRISQVADKLEKRSLTVAVLHGSQSSCSTARVSKRRLHSCSESLFSILPKARTHFEYLRRSDE